MFGKKDVSGLNAQRIVESNSIACDVSDPSK